MSSQVTVSFGPTATYELTVHAADKEGLNQEQARAWLLQQFDELECTPTNPVGKVLLLDMILNVAKYGGERRFAEPGDWARHFAAATSVALDRPAIAVDVANFVVG